MKVAIFTLTRERLEYTKKCFQSLWDRAGMDYDHYVVDNGSQDDTPEWLNVNLGKFQWLKLLPENKGIGVSGNMALDAICEKDYDLVVKFDNDCWVDSENMLPQICEVYEDAISRNYGPEYILSPFVGGLSKQPTRHKYIKFANKKIGITSMVGGIFQVVPGGVYKRDGYRYKTTLPKARGYDSHICDWFNRCGGNCGYIEGLRVDHYDTTDGQAAKYPEYFKRKREEENAQP